MASALARRISRITHTARSLQAAIARPSFSVYQTRHIATNFRNLLRPFSRKQIPIPQPRPLLVGTFHGVKRCDDFAWLQDPENPQVAAYVEAENAYTEACMKKTSNFQARLLQAMQERAGQAEISVPERVDDFVYYSRTDKGAEVPTYCRKRIVAGQGASMVLSDHEEVLIDHVDLVERYGYCSISTVKLSHDHNWVAYTMDTTGEERFDAAIAKLGSEPGSKPELVEVIKGVVNVEWAADGKTIFYTRPDDLGRPHQLYRHVLGEAQEKDVLLLQEDDDSVFLDVSRTKDKCYITINANSKHMSEVRVVDAQHPNTDMVLIRKREPGFEYFVDHSGSDFYIITNAHGSQNYKIISVPDKDPKERNWRDFYVPENAKIEDMDIFKKYCAVYLRDFTGLPRVHVLDLKNPGYFNEVPLPERNCLLQPGANQTFHSDTLRLGTTDPLTPEATFDYDMVRNSLSLLQKVSVGASRPFNPENFTVRKITVMNGDAAVPVTLLHQKDISLDGNNPLLLCGYGAYGHNIDMEYKVERLTLLEMGWVIALCHVRGGGECGIEWHQEGKMLKKRNSFSDLAACAERLHRDGVSKPSLTAATGTSAGGLLVAGLCMQRPELLRAAALKVPFVDCLTAMLDPTLPLTVHEYDEWGNPGEDKSIFDCIWSYSPYENVRDVVYPDMLFTAGLKDQRVPFWQPVKLVAKLRNTATCFKESGRADKARRRLMLQVDWDSGHFGTGGRLSSLEDHAFEIAFLCDSLGLLDDPKWQERIDAVLGGDGSAAAA